MLLLLVLLALLCGSGNAVDYSHVCKIPSSYEPTAINDPERNTTCDEVMQYHTSSQHGSIMPGKDFSSAFSCKNESNTVKYVIGNIADKCCGSDKRSACYVEYNHVCKTPSSYTPNVEYDAGQTCDVIMGKAAYSVLKGKDFSSAFACANENDQVKLTVNRVAAKCCGPDSADPQQSACYVEYNHVCKTPASYTPFVEVDGQTCDLMMARLTHSILAGKDFSSAFACADESDQVKNTVDSVAANCCGSGSAESQRSACSTEDGGEASIGHASSLAVILAAVTPLILFHLF